MKPVLRYTQPLKSKPWVQNTFQEIKNLHSLWAYHLVWKYLFLLHSMNMVLFCLIVWVIWPLANPTTTSVLCKDRIQSFCHDTRGVDVLRSIALHQLLGLPTGHGGPILSFGADIVLSILYVSKALFCPVVK